MQDIEAQQSRGDTECADASLCFFVLIVTKEASVQQGVCFRIYSKQRADSFEEYQLPELHRTPLDEICLQARTCFVFGPMASFRFTWKCFLSVRRQSCYSWQSSSPAVARTRPDLLDICQTSEGSTASNDHAK